MRRIESSVGRIAEAAGDAERLVEQRLAPVLRLEWIEAVGQQGERLGPQDRGARRERGQRLASSSSIASRSMIP